MFNDPNVFKKAEPRAAKRLSILVVDDHETMRKVTASQLASIGHDKVDMAGDGAEALRLLDNKHYDIVISDWNMPNMTGIQLLRHLRSSARHANTPFIMITAEAERSRIEEAIACGVSDLLVKPYAASRLAVSMDKAMTRRPVRSVAPMPQPAPEPAAAAATPAVAPQQATLLLVDDTVDNIHLLADIFNGMYRIRAAHNGQKALDICCGETPPDLVLLDVMMPGMDGFEVARRMRRHPNAENVPIIFVTALDDEASRLKGMELGAVDFITKPIDPVQLKLQVENFMRYVNLRRRLQADYDTMLEMARLRDDVEAMTRHDLKGPLAGAIGIVQALMESRDIDRRHAEQLRVAEQ
ncbi:MAG TPA: response regulator, partial [Burkholderiaceae bacterium]